MTDVKAIPQGTIINPKTGRPSPLNLGLKGAMEGATDYIERRGLSYGAVEDALALTLEAGFKGADRMDGNENGIINSSKVASGFRSALGNPVKGSQGEMMWNAVTELRRAMPDQIQVPSNEHIEQRVGEVVKAYDQNNDGRISMPEADAIKKDIGIIIQSLASAAVSPAAQSKGPEAESIVVPTCITPGVETNCRK